MSELAIQILAELRSRANPENVAGMARYGINPQGTLGVSIYELRRIAKDLPCSHSIALELWDSGIHEARILASIIDEPPMVTREQMERWVLDFDSWDVCDQVSTNLFDQTSYAYEKALEWSTRPEEFVKRAGFTIMAGLAVHDKRATPETFEPFFMAILKEAQDDRNYVKKAVSWALRNLGKRNRYLNERAIQTALEIQQVPSRAARWIASDVLRELHSEKVQKRLRE